VHKPGLKGVSFFIIFSGIILSFSCLNYKPIDLVHPDFSLYRPSLVAVLPMDNFSPDLDASPLIRPIVQERIRAKGYNSLPLSQVDTILKENGVLVSHDVYMFTPQQLGKILGVEALVYGTITEFNKRYALIYSDIKVRLRLEMVDARTEQTLWKSEHLSTDNTLLGSLQILLLSDKPKEALPSIMVYNTAYYALVQYRPFAESAVQATLASLPFGPFPSSIYYWSSDEKSLAQDPIIIWLNTEPLIKTHSPNLKKKIKP